MTAFGVTPRMAGSKFFDLEKAYRRVPAIDRALRQKTYPEVDFNAQPMHRIAFEVAEKHGIDIEEIRSDRRCRKVVLARHELMWRCSHETSHSTTRIGKFLRRDHTTVISGIRAHQRRLDEAAAE